jgi:hypothetical protein
MQSGGEQEAAPRRQATDEEFEHCRAGVAMIQIGLDHVDLIKIGQQWTGRDLHGGGFHGCGLGAMWSNFANPACITVYHQQKRR